MITVRPIRLTLSPLAGLRLALAGAGMDDSLAPMSLFAGTDQPQPVREDQVMDLYDRLRPSLLTYLGGLGITLHEAEDVIHDCFVLLFDHLAAKGEDENLRGWIFRVAHNRAMDLFREGRRIQQAGAEGTDLLAAVIDTSFSPEERAIRSEELRRLRIALCRLTPQQRSAVLLRAEDLRYREISVVLGVSVKRVSELIQRALARLAGDL
jgi:RNA polymerase sigma-70 factor (ECF subfamily)